MKTRRAIAITVPREAVTVIESKPSGKLYVRAMLAWCCGKPFSVKSWTSHYYNVHLRKGSPSVYRTTSQRFRAGTRRTKHIHVTR